MNVDVWVVYICFALVISLTCYLVVLCLMKSLLYAVGLGKGAIPAAAAVNWVLKDGIGYLSKILLSKFGRHFDVNPKGWRLFADLLENAAYGMEILTPAFPHLFVQIGAAAGAGRSAAALIQVSEKILILGVFVNCFLRIMYVFFLFNSHVIMPVTTARKQKMKHVIWKTFCIVAYTLFLGSCMPSTNVVFYNFGSLHACITRALCNGMFLLTDSCVLVIPCIVIDTDMVC